jgi:hypothetical protein
MMLGQPPSRTAGIGRQIRQDGRTREFWDWRLSSPRRRRKTRRNDSFGASWSVMGIRLSLVIFSSIAHCSSP